MGQSSYKTRPMWTMCGISISAIFPRQAWAADCNTPPPPRSSHTRRDTFGPHAVLSSWNRLLERHRSQESIISQGAFLTFYRRIRKVRHLDLDDDGQHHRTALKAVVD